MPLNPTKMKLELLHDIKKSIAKGEKLLALLLDPDKINTSEVSAIAVRVLNLNPNYIFVGGSTVSNGETHTFVAEFKKYCDIPLILFPGNENQLTDAADGLLFLSLISGRNPEYLIEQHLKSVPKLIASSLEIIPTGYILIDGGNETAVQRVSNTNPIAQTDVEKIVHTAKAGEFLGKQLIYLEAGSGAKYPINTEIISKVKAIINIPLIVGGGLRTKAQIENAFEHGADMVVIGTAFEQHLNFNTSNG